MNTEADEELLHLRMIEDQDSMDRYFRLVMNAMMDLPSGEKLSKEQLMEFHRMSLQ